VISFHGVEDHLLPYNRSARSEQLPFELWGQRWAQRDGCVGSPTQTQYRATVEQLTYSGCKAPVIPCRVHHNGHTWPDHPLGLNHQILVHFFSRKTTGKPYPLMVALGLTPEAFADTISFANTDIDASTMIVSFLDKDPLQSPRTVIRLTSKVTTAKLRRSPTGKEGVSA